MIIKFFKNILIYNLRTYHLTKLFLFCFVFYSCNPNPYFWCGVHYELYKDECKIHSAHESFFSVKDSILCVKCYSHYGPGKPDSITPDNVSMDLYFNSSRNFMLDSLNVQVRLENSDTLQLVQWQGGSINKSCYDTGTLNLREIISKIPNRHISSNKYYMVFCYDSVPHKKFKTKFINVNIEAVIHNTFGQIKYANEFKLYSKGHCYHD